MLRVTRSIWRRDDRSRADHRAGSVQTHHVDIDPRTAELGQQLVADSPTCAVVMADLTKPDQVLSNPELGKLVDLTQPVGVLCTAVLHFIADDVDP